MDHVGFRLQLRRVGAGHVKNLLLKDCAVHVVCAVVQRDLREFHPHANPVRGDVVEVVEVQPRDGERAQHVETGRRVLDRDLVVVRLIRQRNEAGKTTGFILQLPKLPHMVDTIQKRLEVAKQHRASAPAAECMPRAMHVEVLFSRLLAACDPVAHPFAENLRASSGQRVEAK